jgi:exodeoxyribonuclease V gamma subunit
VVEDLVAAARALPCGRADAGSVDVKVPLPGGRTLSGTVPGVAADVLCTVTFSRVNPRHRLAAWVRLLALTAARPERAWSAAAVGRVRQGGDRHAAITVARIPPLAADPGARRALALGHLGVLVDLYDRGLREPPPLASSASAAYAAAARADRSPLRPAASAWESTWKFPREDADPEHVLVHGGAVPFSDLLAEPPRADERGPGWDETDPTRFGRWARRLWFPLLACEAVEDR